MADVRIGIVGLGPVLFGAIRSEHGQDWVVVIVPAGEPEISVE